MPQITDEQLKQAGPEIRRAVVHLLTAWDHIRNAEKILDVEFDTEITTLASSFDVAAVAYDTISDDDIKQVVAAAQ